MALKAKGKVGRPRKKAKAYSKDLVVRMDAFADQLIEGAEHCSVETKVAIFANCAKWVAIRNRLGEIAEDGALLDEYRGTLDAAAREATAGADDYRGQHPSGFRVSRPSSGDNGGAELAALVSRLPEPGELEPEPESEFGLPIENDRNNRGDRQNSGNPVIVDAGPLRVTHPQHIGNVDTFDSERNDLDDF